MEDEFTSLLGELEKVARRFFEAGIRAERDRILAGLGYEKGSRKRHAANYGRVSAAVKTALEGAGPEGMSVLTVASGCPDFETKQVRHALKHLIIQGEAIRAARGRYRLSLNS